MQLTSLALMLVFLTFFQVGMMLIVLVLVPNRQDCGK